ncbi:GAF domain-containing protein [Maricaulaceae bacterium MS644]
MTQPPVPLDHPQRLAQLARFRNAALSSGSRLPEILEAARYAFRGSLAVLSCVGPQNTAFVGLSGTAQPTVPTRLAFCRRVVETGAPFIATNLSLDPDYADNVFVAQPPYARFYAGVPVRSESGFVLGAFAVLNEQPSFRFGSQDLEALERFAGIALGMISLKADLRDAA